jgi:hypothetical protein
MLTYNNVLIVVLKVLLTYKMSFNNLRVRFRQYDNPRQPLSKTFDIIPQGHYMTLKMRSTESASVFQMLQLSHLSTYR